MKTQIFKVKLIAALVLIVGCSKDDDVPVIDPGITFYEKAGEWSCNINEDCEDVYQFEFKKDTKIAISIEDVTGKSVVSLDLSAEFGQFGGPNLLNDGKLTYYGCTNQDEEVSISNIIISETGIYNLSVARDWGLSAGFDGTYKVTIISNTAFIEGVSPTNDTEALNYERECL